MTVKEFILKAKVTIKGPEGREDIKWDPSGVGLQEGVKFLQANRSAIVAEVKAMMAEGTHNAVETIEGLDKLRDTINEWEVYRREANRRMDNEGLSSISPKMPKVTVDEVKAEYPRAAAYIKAESWKNSSNVRKYNAGKKALERIVAGEDYKQVLQEMESEWAEYTKVCMWD